MISTDDITIEITPQLHVDVDQSGNVVATGNPHVFKFGDLAAGNFASAGNHLIFIVPDSTNSGKDSWELA